MNKFNRLQWSESWDFNYHQFREGASRVRIGTKAALVGFARFTARVWFICALFASATATLES